MKLHCQDFVFIFIRLISIDLHLTSFPSKPKGKTIMFLLHKSRAFPFLLIIISALISSIDCQATYNSHICLGAANDTASANFRSNLSALLNSLSSKATLNSFYNDSSNGIYNLYLCRGDVSSSTCQFCVDTAVQEIQQHCPSNKSAIIWYDQCMLRYSDTNFFGVAQTFPRVLMWNVQNTTSPDETNYGALGLIYSLIDSVPSTENMFGTDESGTAKGTQKRYALVQCTRDINSSSCTSCLGQLSDAVTTCCQGKIGWRILAPSCNLRYEQTPFFEQQSPPPQTPLPAAPQPVPNNGKGGSNTTIVAIVIAVSSVVVLGALLGFWYYSCYRKRRRHSEGETSQVILLGNLEGSNRKQLMDGEMHISNDDHNGEVHYFNLSTIKAVTNNFSLANKLGEGGFGPVYKGKLPDGQEIAVKRLSMTSKQGLDEFRNEVMVIVKLQHKNLVRLLGYCMEGDEKLLIYEYLANTSLDAFLFDPKRSRELDWAKRANIITGTARGLLYLHEDSRLKIIHRDMKASNVLLDDEMNPKISDFGTARIFGGNQLEANTDRVVGTYGYMAPEYALEGVISIKSDVYSFGILMLEIISGKKNRGFYNPEHDPSLLLHAWKLWNEGKGENLIDPNIVHSCPRSEALRWIHIALLCVQDDPAQRPTMSSVVLMLGSKSVNLPQPSTAPYSMGIFTTMSDQSSISGTGTGFLTSDRSTASVSR
ncbi:cysteine-rich receptor-like protein kinase 25 isoform X2 [Hevea brasiliensis]|uniref:cysteine-rich receptor-like protein kinase 25 isoform X2 n=1 Tax=Hevea brasiliensis TaxID=3981 RepID=UPI0025F0FF0C|nr:cysteine-rich receptor-like protein kinase 25 isoform X2 [Hevea brasiliensis]